MMNNLGEKAKETRSLEPGDKNVSAQAEVETESTVMKNTYSFQDVHSGHRMHGKVPGSRNYVLI